jgi:chitin disaccharide deacetylase
MTRRQIAVCIDDYGLHAGVNEAALALAAQGRVSVVSCMVGAPAWRSGAPALRELPANRVDIGLHLDFTEHPFSPSLRHGLPALIALSNARLLDPQRIAAEIRAQLDEFETAAGQAPDHVDGHQHVHQFPVIREALIEILQQRYPGKRPWLRRTRHPATGPRGFKPWLIDRLGGEALSRLAQSNGFRQNQHLLGVYDFQGSADRYLALLDEWTTAATQGDVLMCHASAPVTAPDAILPARRTEYAVLGGKAFADLLSRANVEIAPLSQIPPPA